MRGWLLLVALAGCRQLFGIEPVTGDGAGGGGGGDGGPRDGLLDGMQIVLADAPTGCYGAGTFTVCLTFTPQTPVTLGATLSTNTNSSDCDTVPSSWTANGQPDACFVIASTIHVPIGGTSVIGTRPLVLLAVDDIVIDGALDVASHVNAAVGPAANASACRKGLLPETGLHGGGAGGSFTSTGGGGGAATGAGGTAGATVSSSTTLRGGCAGQQGDDASVGGTGGNGGGALYAVSRDGTIRVNAPIDASGAGASGGGTMEGGGGGGGSGGMIVLFAATMMQRADVFANGGGGGAGAGGNGGQSTSAAASAAGGTGNAGGGFGAYATASATGGVSSTCGGGGGGGVGAIEVLSGQTLGANVSPPPS